MFKRYFFSALVVVAVAVPSYAQRKDRSTVIPPPVQTNESFRALFKPVVESAVKSTVRVQVDGKDAALGVVVSSDGYVLTKASELKSGKISIKTRDGRDFEGKVAATSEMFDIAAIKVEGTGLVPINWSNSRDEPLGNWLAIPGTTPEPVAVGVMSTVARMGPKPYGPIRVPTEKSGFLGVQLDPEGSGAVIGTVTPDSAAAKAGVQAKDQIIRINEHEIADQETLINTLLGFRAGDNIKILLIRGGKQMELKATLGARPSELIPKKGGNNNRGDFQNSLGSVLSERRTGIPRFFQTDAVVKPSDCGGPVVDLDGKAIGLVIARAGRTESWVIPAETVRELTPVLVSFKAGASREQQVEAARSALKKAEDAKASPEVIAEAKHLLNAAVEDEKWWKDHPTEKAPEPRVVSK